ncbi:DNA modification methylase [Beggiatoa alba B18LD]|uniref:Methyltransferase n=1 Tax=Beggiatoa alba B18LD TaxID=395493 RepID=I3CHU0_9GAMM|nr:site-specific DNA-methyltransferase [Beggiatoa alba]EIJ43183.1 DNA modification methylase [Beggiatoa alba B18LD]
MLPKLNTLNLIESNFYTPIFDVLLANTDSLELLKTIPTHSVELIVSSPPYNLGKSYESRKVFQDYLSFQKQVIAECYRILKPEGNFCWQVGNYVEKGEVFPLDIYYYDIFKFDLGMKLRNRIIWYFGHGLHAQKRFSGRYETILWFSKSDNYIFNLDNVRVPSKYPGKKHFKGEKKGQLSGNPNGKNPSDIWEIIIQDFESCLWDIPNVKSNHPEKTLHPCQYPIELVERLVLALSIENGIVLDPFMGVGSTLLAALLHNRRAIGVDKEKQYVDIIKTRISDLENGCLKKRELGKPVYIPTGKIAQLPESLKKEQGKLL